jgi:hypothetical protein
MIRTYGGVTPKFCAKIGGIKTMKIDPQLAYYRHFEGLKPEICQHEKRLGLSTMNRHTPYAPWAALDIPLQQQDFVVPLHERVQTRLHNGRSRVPLEKVRRRRQQAGRRRRPQAAQHAPAAGDGTRCGMGAGLLTDQSTMTQVLDALTPRAMAQVRIAVVQLDRCAGQARHHSCAHELLVVGSDLTGLSAGRPAEASTKGYGSEAETAVGVNSPGSAPRPTRKVGCR